MVSMMQVKWRLRYLFRKFLGNRSLYFAVLYSTVLLVWAAYGARCATYVPPAGRCMAAPKMWRDLQGRNASAMPLDVEFHEHLQFHTIWTTAGNFSEHRQRTIESIFHHHPNATVNLYSNELPSSALAKFAAAGYDARVRRYDLAELLGDTPLDKWLLKVDRWSKGPYYYSHVTDAMRMALLFKEGGVYIDTDVVVVRALNVTRAPANGTAGDDLRRAGGGTRGAEERSAPGPRPLHPDTLGTEAHTLNGIPVLNGAVMVFARGSPFLWGAMHEFSATYRDYEWGWNGPELLTRMRLRCPRNVTVLPEESFYPFHWEEVDLFSGPGHADLQRELWKLIHERAYTVHLWNKKSGALEIHPRSLYHKLLNAYRVFGSGGEETRAPGGDSESPGSPAQASGDPPAARAGPASGSGESVEPALGNGTAAASR